MKKRLLAMCLVVSLIFTGCSSPKEPTEESTSSSSSQGSSQASQSSESSKVSTPSPEITFPLGYSQLTEAEKTVYDLLESGTVTPETPLVLDQSLTVRQVNQLCSLYQLNRIDYSWQGNQYYAVGTTHVKLMATPRLDENLDEEQMTATFEKRARWYLDQIPQNGTDYEKVCSIASLLCQNVSYYALAADFTVEPSTMTEPIKRLIQEAKHEYGAIVNGQAICTGYAAAFRYLCNQVGIPVLMVYGYTNPFQLHSWNLVLVDGAWYQVDVTWMDQETYQDNTYLLATDFQLSSDHFNRHYLKVPQGETPLHTITLPVCDSTENSWFVQEEQLFQNAETAVTFLKKYFTMDAQIVQVQLASETEYYRLIHAIPEFLMASPLGSGDYVGFGAEVVASNATARTVTIKSKGIAAS